VTLMDSGSISGDFPPPGAQVVYRLLLGDQLQYVGVTNHLLRRISQHLSGAMRYKSFTRIEWEEYDSRYHAETAEAIQIRRHQPALNVAGVTSP
jgi:predicted GIY-YIG superfamily endonuclease